MLEATPLQSGMRGARSQPRMAPALATLQTLGGSASSQVRLSLPSTATQDVERGYSSSDVTSAAIPIGTTILVQQNEAQPSVHQKFAIGKLLIMSFHF